MRGYPLMIAIAVAASTITGPADGQAEQNAGPQPTPFVIGGVLLDIDRLQAVSEPVRRRGTLLVGVADHAGTARIARPMRLTSRIPNDVVQPGAVVHRVEFANPGPDGTTVIVTWCGTMDRKNVFGGQASMICFIEGDPSFRAFTPFSTQAWLNNSMMVSRHGIYHADSFEIAPSQTDLIGPMEVRFELQGVSRHEVTVRLVARRSEQDVVVMNMNRPILNGQAVIPLWSHRLVLSVSGDMVTPVLSDGGDGFGPPEFGIYP